VHNRVNTLQQQFLSCIEQYGQEASRLAKPDCKKPDDVRKKMDERFERMKTLSKQRPELVHMRHSATLFMQMAAPAGATPLHYASSLGADEIVSWLLTCDGVSSWSRDLQGRTPLHYAAKEFRESTCWLLRRAMQGETSSDPVGENAPADLSGTTPLGYATLMAGPARRGGKPAQGVVEALYSPGDRSILPRSPQRTRTGHSPVMSSPSPHPMPKPSKHLFELQSGSVPQTQL